MNSLFTFEVKCCALLVFALLVGCDGEERRAVFPVQGSLIVNGQPAEGALVSFHPLDGEPVDQRGSRPWGTVQADGTFRISTYGQHDGAPVGEYAVAVVWLENPDAAAPVDKLAGRFADPKASTWHARVAEGENLLQPHRIDGARLQRPRTGGAGMAIDPEE